MRALPAPGRRAKMDFLPHKFCFHLNLLRDKFALPQAKK
jgi:hypothetical protein